VSSWYLPQGSPERRIEARTRLLTATGADQVTIELRHAFRQNTTGEVTVLRKAFRLDPGPCFTSQRRAKVSEQPAHDPHQKHERDREAEAGGALYIRATPPAFRGAATISVCTISAAALKPIDPQ
jgi:hypothetical protein